ncbi:hypothetical protein [Zoogloea dura]|jgi:hypothetical protein|uniref:Porin n=1 Tax=Zoogloea dura TaxID=2728840 RepID=A0A848GBE8_9RHOO|nr:hypothetical protein [Zoogloea dura]NML28076.1 hypothetical protein [Zoogloea dura]
MKRLAATLLIAIQTCAGAALASEVTSPSPFSLSGFGTIGTVRTDKDDRAFRSSITQNSGASTNFDFSVDSVLGLQGSYKFSNTLDVTLQSVVRKDSSGSYDPKLTFAFLRAHATPELTIRAGRMRTPFFMYSDSLNLNYASPWVRPPVEVYSLNPFADLDGLDAFYRLPISDMELEVHAYGGRSNLDARESTGNLTSIRGIKASLSASRLTLQANFAKANLALYWNGPIYAALAHQLIATGNGHIVDQIAGSGSPTTFFSTSFQYDNDRLLLIGEYAARTVDRYNSSAIGWYLTSGYRFGPVTPFVTFARQHQVATDNAANTGNASLDATLRLLNAVRNKAQTSVAAGMRWDARRNLALKAQLERIQPGPDGLGIFVSNSVMDNLNPGGPVHVLSLTADFVF